MEQPLLRLSEYYKMRIAVEDVVLAANEASDAWEDILEDDTHDQEMMEQELADLIDKAERARDEADTLLTRVRPILHRLSKGSLP